MTELELCNNIVLTMQIQKIFRAGNSNVITIPSEAMGKLGLKTGDKIQIQTLENKLIIRKSGSVSNKAKELKNWFEAFMEENGEILDELALR